MAHAFQHSHLSGRFTVSGAEEEAALDAMMADADLVTTTEVDANVRARCLREKGWKAVFGNKGSRDDCGLAVRSSRLALMEGGTHVLSRLRYVTERGVLSDLTVGAYGVVKDLHRDKIGVIVVVHMPHGMQDAIRNGTAGGDVAKAYRSIIKGTRRLANGLYRTYHADWAMIVGDWNLNAKNGWVAPYLRLSFPTYRMNFQPPYPKWGTFNNMLFDVALLRGIRPKGEISPLRKQEGFDHRGWTEML